MSDPAEKLNQVLGDARALIAEATTSQDCPECDHLRYELEIVDEMNEALFTILRDALSVLRDDMPDAEKLSTLLAEFEDVVE